MLIFMRACTFHTVTMVVSLGSCIGIYSPGFPPGGGRSRSMSTGSHGRSVHLGRQLPLRILVSSPEAGRYPVSQSANGKIPFLPCVRLEFL